MNDHVHERRKTRGIQILNILALTIASLLVFAFFLRFSRINGGYRSTLAGMLDGTAYRPFVTRVLIPWLTAGMQALIPSSLQTAIGDWAAHNSRAAFILHQYRAPSGLEVGALISLLWQYLSLLGYYFAFRGLLQKVFKVPAKTASILTILSSIGLLPLMFFGYIYDLPSLFLCTLALYAVAANRRTLYFIIYFLALLNKETAVVLTIPSLLLFWDARRPAFSRVLKGVLLQILLFLVVRIPLAVLYRNNPGMLMEFHLMDHLKGIIRHPLYGIAVLVLFACLLVLLLHQWRQKPALVNLGVISGLVLFVMFLIGGMPMEFRIFYEVIAAVMLSIMYTLLVRWKYPLEPAGLSTQQFLDAIKNYFSEKQANSADTPAPSS